MPSALSLDLRRRIAGAVLAGGTVRAVAARFGVSAATAVRLGQKARADLDLAARPRGKPRTPSITAEMAAWLLARLAEKHDLTMRALAAELCERGTPVTHDTVWRFVRGRGITIKKNACGERAGPAGHRALPGSLARAAGRD